MDDSKKNINPETGTKYSRKDLTDTFDLIKDQTNWKNPINRVMKIDGNLTAEMIDRITESVIFFTGSVPTIRHITKKKIRIRASGYYLTIGA